MTDDQHDELHGLLAGVNQRLAQLEARIIFMEARDNYQSKRMANYMPGIAGAMKAREPEKETT